MSLLIDAFFWEYTLITLGFGWWGEISFFVSLFVIPSNIVVFLLTRSMPAVPPEAIPLRKVSHASRIVPILAACVISPC